MLTNDIIGIWAVALILAFGFFFSAGISVQGKEQMFFGCLLPFLFILAAVVLTVLLLIGIIQPFS